MNQADNQQPKSRNIHLIIARIFVTLVALFFSFAIVPKLINEIMEGFKGEFYNAGWEGIVMEVTYLVFMTGFVYSWWKKCIGGIILLLASIIQMGPFLIIDGNLGSLIFGLPMLVSAVLFLAFCKK